MKLHELKKEGWEHVEACRIPVVLELFNGTLLFASSDEEGNSPGVLFGQDPTKNPQTRFTLSPSVA